MYHFAFIFAVLREPDSRSTVHLVEIPYIIFG